MFRNYLKIAWRSFVQNKNYAIINLLGLSVGFCFCILIALFIRNQLSFDNFQVHEKRIAAIGVNNPFFGKGLSTPYPMARAMERDIPEVERAVRVLSASKLRLSRGRHSFITMKKEAIYTEPAFFDIFSFHLLGGQAVHMLSAPRSIVLTQNLSKQLFGNTNPVGKTVYWQKSDTVISLEVTGVMENVPHNSTLQFGALISLITIPSGSRPVNGWSMNMYRTYALLHSSKDQAVLPKQLQEMANTHISHEGPARKKPYFFSVPFSQLHLSTLTHDDGFSGSWHYLYLFGSIALLLLIIASMNYINISTARATVRSKEIGVRKTMGASRTQLIFQFLGEPIMLSGIAYFIGIVLASAILPFFNSIFGTRLNLYHPGFLAIMLLAAIIVGLVSGLYPALFLSKILPTDNFGNRHTNGFSTALLRKTLVAFQFTIALVLIAGVIGIFKQLRYVQTTNLGFDPHNVVTFELNGHLWNMRKVLRNRLASVPGVQSVSVDMGAPADFHVNLGVKPSQVSPEAKMADSKMFDFSPGIVDYNFLNLLHIKLLAGRNFSKQLSSDKTGAYIVNKKFVENLGWTPEQAIGKTINIGHNAGIGKIIGVTQNFHIESMRQAIGPVLLGLKSQSWHFNGIVMVRLSPEHFSGSIGKIKKMLKKYDPNYYGDYSFLGHTFYAMYRTDRRLGKVTAFLAIIAILLSCMGLYGLAMFAAEQRTKEIGIRKVLGASVTGIVALLSKDFLKLVGIGFLIAVPIAWYAMHRWLQNFAYHVNIGIGVFALAGVLAMVIALATVSWQSIKAALANPVESLRNE